MDNAIVNVALAKRGNIDAQIDAYKSAQAKLSKEESREVCRDGVTKLCKGGIPRVFANRTQAAKAAERTGGEAYQDFRSQRFMVRFVA
jgi:hypothetical protein